ncbi:SIR2 family protein [Methylovulum psychrotolerans]|uniref:Uncharacterized protein n=1 Tax=Methylovulum psychrotolerans TaxID=1704499 RepID=A0A1Z4C296_9GAMM|nr:SIR2 family protein [Methylovulum psychrotolerans]ASF47640.1 hypothetical protein CEK71_17085 [Methylovulum psychrotolerans]
MPPDKNLTIDIDYFLEKFKETNKCNDRKFCFLLGAGASKTSGIPLADELVDKWLRCLHTRHGKHKESNFDQWVAAEAAVELDIDGFDISRKAEFYPHVYAEIYGKDDPSMGQIEIQNIIKGKKPSIGYLLLADILTKTRHNMVVTTNFDNLVVDAFLSDRDYMEVHDQTLAHHVNNNAKHPVIAKIHGDRLFKQIHNNPPTLGESWEAALKEIFKSHYIIVIGYAGNDGGLLKILNAANIKKHNGKEAQGHGIFWMHQEDVVPRAEIEKLVREAEGKFVKIKGFDEVLYQLWKCINGPSWDTESLIKHGENMLHEKHVKYFSQNFEELKKEFAEVVERVQGKDECHQETGKAPVKNALQYSGWEPWEKKAQAEPNIALRDAIYQAALKEYPYSAELYGNYAVFLKVHRADYDNAEHYYKLAIYFNPADPINEGNYAFFLHTVRKNVPEAKRLYLKALEREPGVLENRVRFIYLLLIGQEYDEAENYAKQGWELLLKSKKYAKQNQMSETIKNGNRHNVALLALFRGIVYHHKSLDDAPALGRLKKLLHKDLDNKNLAYDAIKDVFAETVKEGKKLGLYIFLYETLKSPSDFFLILNDLPIWKEITLIDLDGAWDD